jgi:hypothetical protein
MTEQETAISIIYPSAADLEVSAPYVGAVYLVPAAEAGSGQPEVFVYTHTGTGQPERSYHRRWLSLGSLPEDLEGESALAVLKGYESELVGLAALYLGAEWDGSNLRGSWQESDLDRDFEISWDEAERYWDASTWLQDSSWTDICRQHGVDPVAYDDLGELASLLVADADGTACLRQAGIEHELSVMREEYLADLADDCGQHETEVA